MPKFRQAIAVLAAAAACIAFNTYRYPVVRQMVSAMSVSAESADAKPGKKPALEAESRDEDHATMSSRAKPGGASVCKDGVCSMPLPDSPTTSLSRAAKTDERSAAEADKSKATSFPERSFSKPPRDSQSDDEEHRFGSHAAGEESQAPKTSIDESLAASGSHVSDEFKVDQQNGARSDTPNFGLPEPWAWKPNETKAEPESVNRGNGLGDKRSGLRPTSNDKNPAAPMHGLSGNPSREGAKSVRKPEAKNRDRKATARLASTTEGLGARSSAAENSSSATSLVPIVRPGARGQHSEPGAADATAGFAAAAKAMAGFSAGGMNRTPSSGVRHLPPIEPRSESDSVSLSPELVSQYPITSAN